MLHAGWLMLGLNHHVSKYLQFVAKKIPKNFHSTEPQK